MDDYKEYMDENYDEYDDTESEGAEHYGSSYGWKRNGSYDTEKPKKFSVLQRTVLISAAIVGAAILITIICRVFFFGGSFESNWHFSETVGTQDQAQVYDYNLKFKDDTVTVELGSLETKGQYTMTHIDSDLAKRVKDGDSKIGEPVVIIENTFTVFDGIFSYNVSGNIFAGHTMTLTNVNYEDDKLKFDDRTVEASVPFRNGEFSKDDKIVGTWEFKDEQGSLTYEFDADGNYTIVDKLPNNTQRQSGIYNCKDGVLTLTYKVGKNIDVPKHYEIKGDKLVINEPVQESADKVIEKPYEYTRVK